MKKFYQLSFFMLLSIYTYAQVYVNSGDYDWETDFLLYNATSQISVLCDATKTDLDKTFSELLIDDIFKVTGKRPELKHTIERIKGNVIIVGTIGNSKLIDALSQSGRTDADSLKGKWERFIIKTIDNPFKGIKKALVIAGSDKRGTAYGALSLSEAIGVSPWYYWSDVHVKKKDVLFIKDIDYLSKTPSVKYRGIFLNDEDWGLHTWAKNNIDTDVASIGPKTYEKVFELVLRLKGNTVAPAMHECTKAFYTVKGNMEMADKYGIMITTSHCEPLLYNNASEWKEEINGEWDYMNNKTEIDRVLDERVKLAHKYDNIYTIALRGKHDKAMKGGKTEKKFSC